MAVSAQYGTIKIGSSALVECRKWSFSRKVAEHVYSSCATSGFKKRVVGPKDGTGSLAGYVDPTSAIEDYIEEGDSVTLKLYYTASKYHQVPAVILGVSNDVDIESGAPVPWEAEFGSDGAYTLNN